jgi:TRAP-type C4-dicarboxylate transport system permease small subunit
MGKLISGVFVILVCIEEIIRTFGHHFYPMVDDFGKQALLWFILIFAGISLVYSAGKDAGKDFFDGEW